MADQSPSILILKSVDLAGTESEEKVCRGIEEEGIPFEVRSDPEDSAVRLAWKAASASGLDVGIGIDRNHTIAVHYARLGEDMPLFTGGSHSESRDLLNLGMNAARLVKGLPFKKL